jgi:hypothetical protein
LHKEELTDRSWQTRLAMDTHCLHDHEPYRNYCFRGEEANGITVRSCTRDELPRIREVYLQYLGKASRCIPGDEHFEALMGPLWELDPSCIVTHHKHDELFAFCLFVPLKDETISILQESRLLDPFFRNWQPVDQSSFFLMAGIDPDREQELGSVLVQTIANHSRQSRWILHLTCMEEWFPVLETFGFERALWADSSTSSGIPYQAYVFDMCQKDFPAQIHRLLPSRDTSASPDVTVPLDNAAAVLISQAPFQTVNQILQNFFKLSAHLDLVAHFVAMFPHRFHTVLPSAEAVQDIRTEIRRALLSMGEQSEDGCRLSKLLEQAYLQRTRPHERIAERFGFSMATYYRHLKKAKWLLAEELAKR